MTLQQGNLEIPEGKDFIFSIFDDTDVSTLGNIKPIYDFLYSLGIFSTKSVWPLSDNSQSSDYRGSETLENNDYSDYMKTLSERGFEIAFHGASMESSRRERTIEALHFFKKVLGFYPRTYAGHAGNRENLYWGENRFTFAGFRYLYRVLNRSESNYFSGHIETSPYYWGDICRKYIDYVRTFTFNEVNLLKIGNFPYVVTSRPYLNACFYSHFADHVEEFNRLLSVENQEKLQQQRGVMIVSTHFGKGFVNDGELNPTTRCLMQQLADRNGYFAPVCDVLDVLRGFYGDYYMTKWKLFFVELRWFVDAICQKNNRLEYEKTELPYLDVK